MQTTIDDFSDLTRVHLWDKDHYHRPRCIKTMGLISDNGQERVSKCSSCGMVIETGYGMTAIWNDKDASEA